MRYWHSLVDKGEQGNNHHETLSQMQLNKEKPDLIMAYKNDEFIQFNNNSN